MNATTAVAMKPPQLKRTFLTILFEPVRSAFERDGFAVGVPSGPATAEEDARSSTGVTVTGVTGRGRSS
jgi:hypothetical protein